jgi:hypothetical protein
VVDGARAEGPKWADYLSGRFSEWAVGIRPKPEGTRKTGLPVRCRGRRTERRVWRQFVIYYCSLCMLGFKNDLASCMTLLEFSIGIADLGQWIDLSDRDLKVTGGQQPS